MVKCMLRNLSVIIQFNYDLTPSSIFVETIIGHVIPESYDCFYSIKHFDHTFQPYLFGTFFSTDHCVLFVFTKLNFVMKNYPKLLF